MLDKDQQNQAFWRLVVWNSCWDGVCFPAAVPQRLPNCVDHVLILTRMVYVLMPKPRLMKARELILRRQEFSVRETC